MEPVVRCGLIAGAISGEVIVLLVLVNSIFIRTYSGQGTPGDPLLFTVWNILYPLLIILIFEIGGIFSARICRRHITPGKNALIPGFITGITAGIILEIMWFSRILSLVQSGNDQAGTAGGFGNIILTVSLLIVLVIMGGVLSAFGSYIYSARTAFVEEPPSPE
jgi:hypothetical protein